MMLSENLEQALDPIGWARSLGFKPDPWQAEVLGSQADRVIMLCARQTGKSETAALVALHAALYGDRALVLLVSPALRQSKELFRKVMDWMNRLDPPPLLIEDTKTSCEFVSRARIVCLPGDETTVRCYSGASLIIADEAARVEDDYFNAVRPMLAVSQGRLMLLSTPRGKRGHFYERWTGKEDNWLRTEITAYECPRITKEFLAGELAEIGQMWFDQEYLCKFLELTGAYFTYETIEKAFSEDFDPFYSEDFLSTIQEG